MEIRWFQNILTFTHVLLMVSIACCSEQKITHNQPQLNSKKENIEITSSEKQISMNDHLSESFNNDKDTLSNQPHSRKKRLIWVTDDGRLALPPGTALTITPTISLPLVRYPPPGFLSNISFSFPVTVDFDKLGLTDNQNPLGDIPLFTARTFGRAAGTMLGNYIESYLKYRKKRDLDNQEEPNVNDNRYKFNFMNDENSHSPPPPPELPENFKHVFHGGERAILYSMVEDLLSTFGLDGKACLLRTICEIHSRPVQRYGVFGEIIKLFLTPTKSPFADLLTEHVRAQKIGEGELPPGECFPYYKSCRQGLFKNRPNYGEENNFKDEKNKYKFDDNLNNEIAEVIEIKSKNNEKKFHKLNEVISM